MFGWPRQMLTDTRAEIVAEARSWIGTRYMHLQRTKGKFTDCVGLIIGVARALGLADYRKRDYQKRPDPVAMRVELHANLDVVPRETMQPGDILWLYVRKDPSHLAIVADHKDGGMSMIHAHSTADRVVEHRLDQRWSKRIHTVFSFKGVT